MKIFTYIILFVGLQSCISYSFVDGSINAETFSVSMFEEQAANSPAGYGGQFTDFLKDFMITRTKLKLKDLDSDIQISGKITNYNTAPAAIQSNSESAALNRLSVSIAVTMINNVDNKDSFESTFTQFSDYDASQDLSTVESELLEDINNKISQDIINKLTSNW
jgi:hypothetical protein